jgi:phospholipase/lecithinase/hemolysin
MIRGDLLRPFTLLLLALGLVSGAAAAERGFDHMVVFGDSLSDIGNGGRFSNGPVWVEQLAARFSVELKPSHAGGLNFAVGGARLDPASGLSGLRAQADLFLREKRPAGRILYIVYGGGNDLLAALDHSNTSDVVDTAAASLKSIIADLVTAGARELLVPNLPDIGMTPALRARGGKAVAEARVLTDGFNAAVERALAGIRQAAPHGTRIYRLDVREMADRARREPATAGFKDVTTPCRGLPTCEGYLFWDEVHPTTQAHGELAEAAFHTLQSQPQ